MRQLQEASALVLKQLNMQPEYAWDLAAPSRLVTGKLMGSICEGIGRIDCICSLASLLP